MNDYIINNKTIAILKKNNQTIIYDVEKVRVINKNTKRIIADNCVFYGSSYLGRLKSAQKILNIKYKVPIILTEQDNLILLPITSLRDKECLILVANKILDYEVCDQYIKVLCVKKLIFKIKISKNSFERLFINAIKLNNRLKWRKFCLKST